MTLEEWHALSDKEKVEKLGEWAQELLLIEDDRHPILKGKVELQLRKKALENDIYSTVQLES